MGRYTLNQGAIASIKARPDVQASLETLGERILETSDANIISMGAVDTGTMLESGTVEREGDVVHVGYTARANDAEAKRVHLARTGGRAPTRRVTAAGSGTGGSDDFPYPAVVHDGTGEGRNSVPRPFLLNAAVRDRGEAP